jgi:hypothetical protein
VRDPTGWDLTSRGDYVKRAEPGPGAQQTLLECDGATAPEAAPM